MLTLTLIKSGMAAKHNESMVTLTKEYPIGNFDMFPDKRVWKNETMGSYFELTPECMKFWANAIVGERIQSLDSSLTTVHPWQHFSQTPIILQTIHYLQGKVVCETPPLASLTTMVQIRLMCPARTSHDHLYAVNKDHP